MVRQILHVLGSYLTRKGLWVLAAIYVLTIVFEATMPIRQTPLLWNETQVRWMPRQEFNGMTEFLDWQATDDELRNLRGLTLHGDFVESSDRLGTDGQKMAFLKTDDVVLPEHLAKLAKCVQLMELSWTSVRLTPEIGQTLSKLPQLRKLELSLIGDPIPSLSHLPAMPQLELFQLPGIPSAELGLLAKHPRLRTIILQDSFPLRPIPGTIDTSAYGIYGQPSTLHQASQVEQVIVIPASEHQKASSESDRQIPFDSNAFQKPVPISESLISELARMPNLKAVEVHDLWGGWPARAIDDPGLRKALAQNPSVTFNPLAFDSQAILSPFVGLSSLFLLAILGLQMFSHLATPVSHTTPNFARPHLLVAGMLLVVHVGLVVAITMIRRDVGCLPAIVLALATPALGILLASLASHRPATFPLLFPLTFLGIMTLFILGPVIVEFAGGREFFRGALPGRALAILVCEIAAILWAARILIQLPRRFSEAGIPVGLGLPQTLQQLQMQKLNRPGRAVRLGKSTPNLFERRLESFLADEGNSNAARKSRSSSDSNAVSTELTDSSHLARWATRRWQAGEPGSPMSFLFLCLFGPWLMIGSMSLFFGLINGEMISGKLFVFYCVVFGTFALTLATYIRSIATYSRRNVLPQELLRPMGRSEMVHHLCTSMWLDLRPAIVVTLGYLFTLMLIHSWGPKGWRSQSLAVVSFGHALLVLAIPVVIWGGTVFLLSLRKEWWVIVTYIAGGVLFMVIQIHAMVRLIPSMPTEAAQFATLASYGLAFLCVVIGLGLAQWGSRRLLNVEWGATG